MTGDPEYDPERIQPKLGKIYHYHYRGLEGTHDMKWLVISREWRTDTEYGYPCFAYIVLDQDGIIQEKYLHLFKKYWKELDIDGYV